MPTIDDRPDIWTTLSAALPPDKIQWRQQGKPQTRDGRHIARFVAYIDAQFVQERLDSIVAGEWDLTISELPPAVSMEGEEIDPFNFKARLQVLGVIREDVGSGRDYKTAATDAFKRAAVRFGIGRELYSMEQVWVQMDGDGKYAKPLEDPSVVYARKHARPGTNGQERTTAVIDGQKEYGAVPERETGERASGKDEVSHSAAPTDEPLCPKCDGKTWDNRLTKRNPKAPDFNSRDRSCDGVIWPPKPGEKGAAQRATEEGLDMEPLPF